ncbi:hypothetical protein BSU04_13985 [Caballeronia sordidicola]|uniref:Uncharacterized protein n=1 Tax=Caballeronia sordidicola TaxID=196367 RepID=A0A226X3L4_CABSO|nr:hypothetical protein BSU04_13985 [Caballeronia sordidicola]
MHSSFFRTDRGAAISIFFVAFFLTGGSLDRVYFPLGVVAHREAHQRHVELATIVSVESENTRGDGHTNVSLLLPGSNTPVPLQARRWHEPALDQIPAGNGRFCSLRQAIPGDQVRLTGRRSVAGFAVDRIEAVNLRFQQACAANVVTP